MSVLIVGNGKSGRAVFDYLSDKNNNCCFAKSEDISAKNFDEKYINDLLKDVEFAVVSPGISLENRLILEVKKRKIIVVGELEFGFNLLISNENLIAVTGTNGKTTTVSLIDFLFNKFGIKSYACGNIGVPLTEIAKGIKNDEKLVVECSSFQLESIKNFRPKIAIILNVTEDHLNRHKTIENYAKCKYKITQNQTKNDYIILNADDEFLMKNPPKKNANIFYFSTKKEVVGCFVKNGSIYFNDNTETQKLLSVSKIKLPGMHNLSNCLAAILSVYLITKNKKLFENISLFSGVEHRIEYVKTIRGVEFFNDSKATNISSTLVALSSFDAKINLILGGSDKGLSFDELFEKLPKNVKNIAIIGEIKNKIAFFAQKHNFKNFYLCDSLDESVRLLYHLAEPGEIVLLSPACASFDCFSNFEERGEVFKKIAKEIEIDESSFTQNDKKT